MELATFPNGGAAFGGTTGLNSVVATLAATEDVAGHSSDAISLVEVCTEVMGQCA
jgi:hypothetical protein